MNYDFKKATIKFCCGRRKYREKPSFQWKYSRGKNTAICERSLSEHKPNHNTEHPKGKVLRLPLLQICHCDFSIWLQGYLLRNVTNRD